MDENITTFGEKIEDLRKERHLTQAKLADAIGAAGNTLHKYENKSPKDISFYNVIRLAEVLEVSLDYLAGLKNNKDVVDTPVEELRLTNKAYKAVSDSTYDHELLSDLLSHPGFHQLMLDIAIYTSQAHTMFMLQNNAMLEFVRKQVLEKTEGKENLDSRLSLLSRVDTDLFVLEAIHNDLDIILKDMMDKRKPKRYEAIKEIQTRNIVKELEQALENSKDETIGSEEQLFSIMIGQLQIPEDTISDEMKKAFMDVIKLSPILKSPISQRGKKSQEKNSKKD